jgi:hypothetical protein
VLAEELAGKHYRLDTLDAGDPATHAMSSALPAFVDDDNEWNCASLSGRSGIGTVPGDSDVNHLGPYVRRVLRDVLLDDSSGHLGISEGTMRAALTLQIFDSCRDTALS